MTYYNSKLLGCYQTCIGTSLPFQIMENGFDEEALLFDASLIENIDWESKKVSFKGDISPCSPGENLLLRPLSTNDFAKGFITLLSQLTSTGNVSREKFQERFYGMKSCPNTYYVAVVEDTLTQQIVGSATLVVEQKFIHSTAIRGRIEDVVVHEECRGKQLGKLLVETMTLLGKQVGCYKMSLECKQENVKFYEIHGYSLDEQLYMIKRFHD